MIIINYLVSTIIAIKYQSMIFIIKNKNSKAKKLVYAKYKVIMIIWRKCKNKKSLLCKYSTVNLYRFNFTIKFKLTCFLLLAIIRLAIKKYIK
jgi:hypothetical protein